MVETGDGTVTPVVSNLRIDPALVDGYLPFAHFFPSFFIRMLYLLHSLVKYICMPIYPRVLVYQDLPKRIATSRLCPHRKSPGRRSLEEDVVKVAGNMIVLMID